MAKHMYELAEKASMHTCCEESFPKQDMRKIFEFHFPVLKSHLEKKKKKKKKKREEKTRLPTQKQAFTVTAFYKMILSYVPCL